MNEDFGFPIPGASLTTEPKGYAWERPPEYNTVEEALDFYIGRLENPDVMDDIYLTLEEGFPLEIFVSVMLTNGVMEGYHSTDIKLLLAPVLHQFILIKANAVGINVVEKAKTEKSLRDKKEKSVLANAIQNALRKAKKNDKGTDLLEDIEETLEEEAMDDLSMAQPDATELPSMEGEEMSMDKQPSQGLMSRRNV